MEESLREDEKSLRDAEKSLGDAEIHQVWDFWNDCEIVKHRDLSKFRGAINGRLRFYSASELCEAIQNYNDILHSDRHWFSYRWTLDQFLTRKSALDNFIDREIALTKYKKGRIQFEDEDRGQDDGAEFYRAINREDFNSPGGS